MMFKCLFREWIKIILHKIPEVKTVSCGLWVKAREVRMNQMNLMDFHT